MSEQKREVSNSPAGETAGSNAQASALATPSKLMSLSDAIARFVPDGASVAMGCALEPLIPFAAGHELIRQRKRDLTLIGPISDILFDELIGAGCVSRVVAAWVGNVSEGLGHNYRRATEHGQPHPLEVVDHSNYSVSLALLAGALGVPYIPMRSLLGSDIARDHPDDPPRALAAGWLADAARPGARTRRRHPARSAGGCRRARTRLGRHGRSARRRRWQRAA